jgi:UDP-glucose 4-epimerase
MLWWGGLVGTGRVEAARTVLSVLFRAAHRRPRGKLTGMRVLVTGGAGFIGSHVADALLQEGHAVVVVDDLSTGRQENVPVRAAFRQGDIRDQEFLRRVFDEFRPEVVSHQAAQTSVAVSTREPVRDAQINVVGSLQLFEQCVHRGVQRVVFASTGGAVYGEVPEPQCASLDWAPRPLSPYACSKFAVECYLRAYAHEHGLRSTILRYANVYGPRQDPHGEAGVVAIFAQRLLDGQPLQINARRELGDAGCVRDYVFVGDVVRCNRLAVEGAIAQPIVNVCTGEPTSTLELARALGTVLGVEPELHYAPRRPGDIERSVLDGGALLAGHPPTTLGEGVRQTVAWFETRRPQ